MSSIFARAVIDATLIKPCTKGCGAFVVTSSEMVGSHVSACRSDA